MDYMNQALSLAKLALGHASPNPAVGTVVVKDDTVVGQGYTQPPGSPHAEAKALKQAGEQARGGTMYVTLEPCCHYGRTSPCTQSIIAAGIIEVHLAMIDPNPQVAGKGREELSRAGIKVYVGEHETEAREITEAYTKLIISGTPFVTVKFAASLDGKIATRDGDSKWISGDESRKRVHYLRYASDAIMAGINTILADDPLLTSRCCSGRGGKSKKQPLRVIVDSQGRTPPTARLFTEPGRTLLALGRPVTSDQEAVFAQLDAEVVAIPAIDGQVDLVGLLALLGGRQITSVLVEGGGTLVGSLFDHGLVDKVVAFIAPIIIGGEQSKTAVAGSGVAQVVDAIRLKRVRVVPLGDDLMISGYLKD